MAPGGRDEVSLPPSRRLQDHDQTPSRSKPKPLYGSVSIPAQGTQERDRLDHFVELCNTLYYGKDMRAGQIIDTILSKLPGSSRTLYARTMASVRTSFHRSEELRRRQLAESTLLNTLPGGAIVKSLDERGGQLPIAPAAGPRVSSGANNLLLKSRFARQERAKQLSSFIQSHFDRNLPGPHPFLIGLYNALQLQCSTNSTAGENGRPAGNKRVEWEVEVNVFTEAGGGSWLQDSIGILKGTLGCSEVVQKGSLDQSTLETEPTCYFSPDLAETIQRSSYNPAPSSEAIPSIQITSDTGLWTEEGLRSRSVSDPFIDPADEGTQKVKPRPTLYSTTSDQTTSDQGPLSLMMDEPSSPLVPSSPILSRSSPSSPRDLPSFSPLLMGNLPPSPPPQNRIFTFPPYLTNPEIRCLFRLFPTYIVARATSKRRGTDRDSAGYTFKEDDVESVTSSTRRGSSVRVGHGDLRVGDEFRDEGWQGTLWERMVSWFMSWFVFLRR